MWMSVFEVVFNTWAPGTGHLANWVDVMLLTGIFSRCIASDLCTPDIRRKNIAQNWEVGSQGREVVMRVPMIYLIATIKLGVENLPPFINFFCGDVVFYVLHVYASCKGMCGVKIISWESCSMNLRTPSIVH